MSAGEARYCRGSPSGASERDSDREFPTTADHFSRQTQEGFAVSVQQEYIGLVLLSGTSCPIPQQLARIVPQFFGTSIDTIFTTQGEILVSMVQGTMPYQPEDCCMSNGI